MGVEVEPSWTPLGPHEVIVTVMVKTMVGLRVSVDTVIVWPMFRWPRRRSLP